MQKTIPMALLCLLLAANAAGQTAPHASGLLIEHGKYTVHLLLHPVGTEEYGIFESAPLHYMLVSNTAYSDRGVAHIASTSLDMGMLSTPSRLEEHVTVGGVEVSSSAELKSATAVLREGSALRTIAKPAVAFPGSASMPAALQMVMMRYWNAHGRPPRLPLLHAGAPTPPLEIELVGHDAFYIKNQMIRLSRYTVKNLVFGREILWMNDSFRLAAVMSFAGGLPREVVLDEYESLTGEMLHNAIRQEMLDLATIQRGLSPEAEGSYAIMGARLFDGTGAAPIQHATVVVRDGRIASVGEGPAPAGLRVVHAEGQTVLPGLWDLHVHYSGVEYGPALLAAGVTSARDIGGEMEFLTAIRRKIDNDHALGPKLLLAGSIDGGGPRGFGFAQASTPGEGVAAVDSFADTHFDQVYLYPQLQPAALEAIVAEAHRRGLTVARAEDPGPQAAPGQFMHDVLPGEGLIRELERQVQNGTTPAAAIQSATLLAARAMKLDRESGSIQPGKRADLILIQGDPLNRIGDLRRVVRVVKDGRMYDAGRLRQSVGLGR